MNRIEFTALVATASERPDLAPNTVYRWEASGKITPPPAKEGHSNPQYSEADLPRYVELARKRKSRRVSRQAREAAATVGTTQATA